MGLLLCWSVTAGFAYMLFRWWMFFDSIDKGQNDFATIVYVVIGLALFFATAVGLGASAQIAVPTFRRIFGSARD